MNQPMDFLIKEYIDLLNNAYAQFNENADKAFIKRCLIMLLNTQCSLSTEQCTLIVTLFMNNLR